MAEVPGSNPGWTNTNHFMVSVLTTLTKENTMVQRIKIDDVEYVRADSLTTRDGDIKIAVLDRGFVYVGHVTVEEKFVVIRDAKNIRVWGTTKGLGELVNGPTNCTKLDSVGTVRVNIKSLNHLIDVEQDKWKLS